MSEKVLKSRAFANLEDPAQAFVALHLYQMNYFVSNYAVIYYLIVSSCDYDGDILMIAIW